MAGFESFMQDPNKMALLMGGLNMMQASRGGNTDLTKGGIGYALNQGLAGGMQGYQAGTQMKQQAQQEAFKNSLLGQLQPGILGEQEQTSGLLSPLQSPAPQQNPLQAEQAMAGMNPMQSSMQQPQMQQPANNPFSGLSPIQKQIAAGMIGNGDWAGLEKITAGSGRVGNFDSMDQYLKALQTTRKEANTQLAPTRESMRKFGQATDILNKRGSFVGMNGADDTVLIKGLASMILPGEAVMEGDIATIVNQSGLPGTVQSYLQAFKGKGQLGEAQRAEIYNAMVTLSERATQENTEIRSSYKYDIEQGGFPGDAVFRPKMTVDPFKAKQTVVDDLVNKYAK